MLLPNDIAPKSKAASIRSLDSGYGSNTLEDDKPHQRQSQSTSADGYAQKNSARQPIGRGTSAFWNVHVEDQLRLRRPESPVDPVVTKVNVFTTKVTTTDLLPLPTLRDNTTTCITCQFWSITNPGQGEKCNSCEDKDYIRPEILQLYDTKPKAKLTIPSLEIPKETQSRNISARRNKTRCTACDLARVITPRTSPTCPSCTPDPDLLSPISPIQPSTVKRSCARRPNKLPQHALHHLRAWLRDNRDDPYPSPATKHMLAQQCGITEKQVTTWFTNTRARKFPLLNDRSHPSSEDEGAYESDLSSIANTPIAATNSVFGYSTPSNHQCTPFYPESVTSDPTQLTLQTSRRGKKKDYRRLHTVSPIDESPIPRTPATLSPNPDGSEQETWQCTFCYKPLVPKSWRRHEETQHRPKYQWTCLATSPRIPILSRTGTSSLCAFCSAKNPSDDHFHQWHRIMECSKKSEADRTFGRPDHLRQHIKNFHKTSLLDMVRDKWRRDGPGKNVNEGWTCGFCAQELKTWDIRETHIANHFKKGLNMSVWRDYPQPAASVGENKKRRSSCEERTTIMAKLKRTFTGRPNRQPEYQPSSQSQFSNTFAPFPATSGCSSTIGASMPSAIPNMGLGVSMSDTSMIDFDFSGPSTAGNFDSMYPVLGQDYENPLSNDAMQMDFEALANTELYGNFFDYQADWEQNL